MHRTKLEAAVKRHGGKELKPLELLQAIKDDEKEFNDDEINEIFEAILTENSPLPAAATIPSIGINSEPAPFKSRVEYKVCHIWHGTWVATDWTVNPMTGQRAAIAFEFLKNGTAKRENVKVEPHRIKEFNEARHINISGIAIEQLIPIDHTGEWTYQRKVINGIPQ